MADETIPATAPRGAGLDDMTWEDRLGALVEDLMPHVGVDWFVSPGCEGRWRGRDLRALLLGVLREARGALAAERRASAGLRDAVGAVADEMARSHLGCDIGDDAPVVAWERGLRAALGPETELQRTVREVVERSTVPVGDLWEARRERDLYRECLDALRSAVVGEEVTVRGVETDGELLAIVRHAAERAARARDACEGWPRLEGGAPLRLGDEAIVGGVGVVEVSSVEVSVDGFALHGRLDGEVMGGRLHFPAGTLVRGVQQDSWGRVLRDASAGAVTEGELERRARALAARG